MAFNLFWFCLKLSLPEKFKYLIFETAIARKLVKKSLKNIQWSQFLLLSFLRYCCLKVDWYLDPYSGSQGVKGLKFPKKYSKN